MENEYKQSNYKLGATIDGMCNSFIESKTRENCKYYQEEKHMGATIPCCVKNPGLGNCPCEECNELKKFSSDELYKQLIWSLHIAVNCDNCTDELVQLVGKAVELCRKQK